MASVLTIVAIITALSEMAVVAEYFDPIHNATVERTLEGVERILAQHTRAMEKRLTKQEKGIEMLLAKQTGDLEAKQTEALAKQTEAFDYRFTEQDKQTEALETQLGNLEKSMADQNSQLLSAISDLSLEHQDLLHDAVTFLRRQDGSVDFYRNWADYKAGFGDRDGEFWLGLDSLHQLTSQYPYRLRVNLTDWSGARKWAEYSTFRVASETEKFKLTVSGYNSASTAGDSLKRHNGKYFTTKDRDNDNNSGNCATQRMGGWWYDSCTDSNLMGLYKPAGYKGWDGIVWLHAYGDTRSFKEAILKLIKA